MELELHLWKAFYLLLEEWRIWAWSQKLQNVLLLQDSPNLRLRAILVRVAHVEGVCQTFCNCPGIVQVVQVMIHTASCDRGCAVAKIHY